MGLGRRPPGVNAPSVPAGGAYRAPPRVASPARTAAPIPMASAAATNAAIGDATRDLPRPGANATIGASAGVACFPEDGEERAELLARADAALYRAKAAGKGKVYRAAPPLPDHQM